MDSLLHRAAVAALTACAVASAFELQQPIARVAGIEITLAEAAAYVTLVLWAVGWVRSAAPRLASLTPVHLAAATWAVVALAAALWSPLADVVSLKAGLRLASGCALCWAAADLLVAASARRRVLGGLVLGALVSAAAALVQIARPGPIGDALQRATGTFSYPNIAAMYWEMALPIALAWGAAGRRWGGVGAMAAALVAAVVASESRAGVVTAALTLAGLALLDRDGRIGLRRGALVAAAALAVAVAADAAARPGARARLQLWPQESWYAAEYHTTQAQVQVEAGAVFEVEVRLRNVGRETWAASGPHAVSLGHQWPEGEGAAAPLAASVAPGGSTALRVKLVAPPRAGPHPLVWHLVMNGLAWSPAEGLVAEVRGSLPAPAVSLAPPRAVQRQATRLELWRAGLGLWRDHLLLGIGPDNFRRLYATRLGSIPLDPRVNANSAYIETLADLGIAGALALAGLALALGSALRRTWREVGDAERPLVAGIAAGLAAFAVHGLVDCFWAFTPTANVFWILVGAAGGLGQREVGHGGPAGFDL
jgi:O-antigen ligase